MKRILCSIAALAFCAPLLAWAAEGWVVDDVTLQAGPDVDYPPIAELEAGTPVSIQGCIDGWSWCDVIVADDRGWVPGTFLEEEIGGRPVVIIDAGARIGIPIVSFEIGSYWGRHYHNRPFFAERARFESHEYRHSAPPRPTRVVATAPRPEARPKPASGTAMQGGGATMRGTATTRGTTQGTTTRQATTTRERSATGQRTARAPAQAPTAGTETQRTAQQRNREEQQRTRQTARSEQPPSRTQQARAERPKPSDQAPQMIPKNEHPTAQRPQPQQRQTQVARNATPRDERSSHQGPKPKDELKKADNRKKDNRDNGDNGGGGR